MTRVTGQGLSVLGEVAFVLELDAVREPLALAGALRFIIEASRFATMAELAEALARFALAPKRVPAATRVTVTLEGLSSCRVERTAAECHVVTEDKFFGAVDVLFETAACGVYLERLAAGQTLPAHVHAQMDESELVLDDGLLLQGAPIAAGLAHDWPRQLAHRYDNPTARELAFLCIDRPSFIPSDETFVETAALVRVPSRRYF